MFCPLCQTYLTEPDLVRRNMKYMGSVVVEYDARCPRCTEEIGHVSWGQFTVLPELEGLQIEADNDLQDQKPLIPTPELRPVLRKHRPVGAKGAEEAPPQEEQAAQDAEVELCPHCGQPMPKAAAQ